MAATHRTPRCSNQPRRRPTAWPHPSKIRRQGAPSRTLPGTHRAEGTRTPRRHARCSSGTRRRHAPRRRSAKPACPRRHGPPTSRWTPSTASAWTGKPVVRTYRTATKGKTRYEFDYPLEDTYLAGEAQTVCQAPFARPRQLLGLPPVPSEKSRRPSIPRRSKRLAATHGAHRRDEPVQQFRRFLWKPQRAEPVRVSCARRCP